MTLPTTVLRPLATSQAAAAGRGGARRGRPADIRHHPLEATVNRLLRFLPARLVRRLGHELALHDPAALAAALEANLDAARAGHDAELRSALRKMTGPLAFQPGLVDLHQESADIVVYLCSLVAAAETNLDLDNPGQYALYRELLDSLRTAEELRQRVAAAASRALPAAPSTAELQHL